MMDVRSPVFIPGIDATVLEAMGVAEMGG